MTEKRAGFCVELGKTWRQEGPCWKLGLAIKEISKKQRNVPEAVQEGEVQVAVLRSNQLQMYQAGNWVQQQHSSSKEPEGDVVLHAQA